MSRRARILNWVALAVVLTIAATLLWLNASLGDKQVERRVEPLYSVADPQFLRTMGAMLGPAVVPGNRVQALQNGDEIFPAMLVAVRGAQQSINFETYIYWSGEIGREFADALIERAGAGVQVHVLMDWVGSEKMEDSLIERLRAGGVEVRRYNRPRWHSIGRFNNRTHRKLLVVDGKVGFTGGVGVADLWAGNAQDADHWRDSHYRVEGPAVGQMQAAFLDNWLEVTGRVEHGPDFFPPLVAQGEHAAQLFMSSPGGGAESMQLMYLLSITAARQSIRIAASYFVPDELTVQALVAAMKRGVKVEIILPGPHIDQKLVRRASRGTWGPLLAAGAEIHEFQPTMFHCKVMVVDELWTSVGSTNFDARSFSLNDEANLNVYDREFARAQVAVFDADRARSRRITLADWQRRPWHEKLRERVAVLLRSQL